MDAILDGRDSLVVLPTGGGKSLCFQAPALVRDGLGRRRLAADLADEGPGRHARRQRRAAACYNSTLASDQKARGRRRPARGALSDCCTSSPERLVGDGGDGFLHAARAAAGQLRRHRRGALHQPVGPRLPSGVPPARRDCATLFPGVSLHAYTATATARVRRDIAAQLGAARSGRARRLVRSARTWSIACSRARS